MVNNIIKYLSSLRCTLAVIISLSTMFLLSFILPQKDLLKKQDYLQMKGGSPIFFRIMETLGLTDVYTSPVTLALWALFFLNLALVMRQRVPLVLKRIECSPASIEDPRTASSYPVRLTVPLAKGRSDTVQEVLTRAGYRFYGAADRFYAVKNRLSPLATILFHLSFFLILLAGVVTTYTKFVGYLEMGIGESFHGELSRYKGSPRMPKVGRPPVAGFALEKVQPHVDQNVATGLEVVVRDDRGGIHIADINRPYKAGATSFLVNDLGVAPLVVIVDEGGRDLDGAYVKLDVMKGKKDRFRMLGYDIEARYFSDHLVVNGVDETKSDAFSNPAMRLEVSKNGAVIAARTLKAGESLELDGNRLVLREMPFWVRFLVVKQHGDWIAYAGFIIATLALCWRLLLYRREIVGTVEQTVAGAMLHLACRCEFYRTSSGQELDRISELLKGSRAG